jgi:hypothetical protein
MRSHLAKLTNKQRVFVEEYLQCWNASEAARRAGYSEKSASVIGHENLRKPEIARAIRARIDEKTMQTDEILCRLTDIARGDMGEFIQPESLYITLGGAVANKKTHLIKKIKYVTYTNDDAQTETVEFELYDAHKALMDLAKLRGLVVDKTRALDWRDEALDLIRKHEVDYEALVNEFGSDLATELFKLAGVPVEVESSAESDA